METLETSSGISTGTGAGKKLSPLNWRRLFFLKNFKTIDEQIQILLERGLIINDIEKAKLYLLSQNYYNIINGYASYFPRDG